MGWVSNIQRFCVHDGDGIRTVVFMQGCPLACRWCSNPENLTPGTKLKYNEELCVGCGNCVEVCPQKAIVPLGRKMQVDRKVCEASGECTRACLSGALSLVGAQISAQDVLDEVRRDRAFYRRSGGGLTLSGGECMAQPRFTAAVLRLAKQEGIHTAIETCGAARWEDFEVVLPDVDLVLYDLKHTDSHIHEQQTGVGNTQILANLQQLKDCDVRLIVRVPMIAGINDDPENLTKTAQLAAQAGVERIELLPFHQLGERKYPLLGMQAPSGDLAAPDDDALDDMRDLVAKESGIDVVVHRL